MRVIDDLCLTREDPRQPEVAALVAALDAEHAGLYPPESTHRLDVAALAEPEVTFIVARLEGRPVGCAAVLAASGHGEIKRMFVDPQRRGNGVAPALLRRLEAEATALGLPCLRLETGIEQPAAIRFYARSGFRTRPTFGSYTPDPLSLFFEKSLTAVVFDAVGPQDEPVLVEFSSAFHAGEGRALGERSRAAIAAVCAGEPLARTWLIKLHDRLAGYVLLTLGFGIEYGGRDVFLDEIYLTPEARGCGLGAAAMAFVERQAGLLGAVAIHLVVAPGNRRAQSLYRRCGYTDAGWRLLTRGL